MDRSASNFTPDITPLILAAHMNNYEILKILLDRGATLPTPHDVRCGCDDCITSSESDSLRHSQSRINAYRALSSASLIALSARDPLLTAFELSWELRNLSSLEQEFKTEYIVSCRFIFLIFYFNTEIECRQQVITCALVKKKIIHPYNKLFFTLY